MELPVYQLVISQNEDDETEVDFVSLVDRPAIERDFLAFKDKVMLSVADEDKRLVSGPAMIPDMPIYRRDKEKGEYYVVFSADTISCIAQRFFKKGYQANINLDHERTSLVEDSMFYESWLVDREAGKMPLKGFEDLPDGTWFLTAKINNEETWTKIKDGKVRGFSVEGLFVYEQLPADDTDEEVLSEIAEILRDAGIDF